MTTQFSFDKLAYVDRLKEAGVDERHARAHAEGLGQALREEIATRRDLEKLGTDLRVSIEAAKSDTLRWTFGSQFVIALALGGFLFTVLHKG